jgi:hypothetical protein
VTPARSGRFKVVFTLPKSLLGHAAIVVRAQTKVARPAHGARGGSRHAVTAIGLARTLPI